MKILDNIELPSMPAKTDFINDEFLEFVTEIKKRSVYNFSVDVSEEDQVLTLSTCAIIPSNVCRLKL